MIRRPPISTRTDTLFPDTTLFRSEEAKYIQLPLGDLIRLAIRHLAHPTQCLGRWRAQLESLISLLSSFDEISGHLKSLHSVAVAQPALSTCTSASSKRVVLFIGPPSSGKTTITSVVSHLERSETESAPCRERVCQYV